MPIHPSSQQCTDTTYVLDVVRICYRKSIGFGIENIWYRKKYRIRYWKNLVSAKSFGFGFVQILGIVTHYKEMPGQPKMLV